MNSCRVLKYVRFLYFFHLVFSDIVRNFFISLINFTRLRFAFKAVTLLLPIFTNYYKALKYYQYTTLGAYHSEIYNLNEADARVSGITLYIQ